MWYSKQDYWGRLEAIKSAKGALVDDVAQARVGVSNAIEELAKKQADLSHIQAVIQAGI